MKQHGEIGKRIKALRERFGMSKSELARHCKVTTTAVWNWEENGRVARGETLALAAKALGVSLHYLTGHEAAAPASAQSSNPTRTVASIIEDARSEIATITGVPLSNVRLNVEFMSQ